MILGMSASTFTNLHVVISLIGIASGLVVLFGILNAKALPGWTGLFLAATILTSVTGFFFPAEHLLPSHVVAIISLAVLALALVALYLYRLAGAWRWVYVVTATVALYFNCFVGVAQAFQKIPAVHALAPTQAEPPFLIAQIALLAIFVVLGFLAVKRFHPAG
jgi:hypothetical protein